ncbi:MULTISPECIES: Gfo/Idh/MocA family protein [unclassified Paenibacillus]|uniref:Gfo/Idh/MocA family protein n=1 Tax=unclassified Paenibacillus TaxID=185978 RepID=UPI00362E603C
METIKVGIIGTGFSANFHIEALRRVPGVEILAVAGSTMDKALVLAEQYRIPYAYETYHALLSNQELDVIHNCTPNYLHFEINRAVILAGKDLLSEKPLAMNSSESGELVSLAEQMGTIHGVCFNYRHFPMVMQAHTMLMSRQNGKCHLVTGGYLQDWLLFDTDYSWRLEPELNGPSRAIADIGSHWCDTMQFVLGKKIVEVFADLKTIHPIRKKPSNNMSTYAKGLNDVFEEVDVSTEDCGSVLVHFEDDISGVFTVSQVSAGRKNKLHFEISSADFTLYWDQENPNTLWEGRRNEPNKEWYRDPALLSPQAAALAHLPGGHQEGWSDGLKNLFLDFYNEIKRKRRSQTIEGERSFATLADGHHNMKIVDAILISSQQKEWIRVC